MIVSYHDFPNVTWNISIELLFHFRMIISSYENNYIVDIQTKENWHEMVQQQSMQNRREYLLTEMQMIFLIVSVIMAKLMRL